MTQHTGGEVCDGGGMRTRYCAHDFSCPEVTDHVLGDLELLGDYGTPACDSPVLLVVATTLAK